MFGNDFVAAIMAQRETLSFFVEGLLQRKRFTTCSFQAGSYAWHYIMFRATYLCGNKIARQVATK